MDDGKLLSESAYCRLCCAANVNGINLFTQTENSEDMSSLVNRYLPIKVCFDASFLSSEFDYLSMAIFRYRLFFLYGGKFKLKR